MEIAVYHLQDLGSRDSCQKQLSSWRLLSVRGQRPSVVVVVEVVVVVVVVAAAVVIVEVVVINIRGRIESKQSIPN
ncbi:hypothetical protein ElyMa_000993300 [Elysia marginata]|uniref:Uncharacterized protein n=1 Tax=Elysia marginata TaxID=1093978 RepID=A0AAV4HH32_9GAST|nr:hypothetical protein ElyMa_000993300 [Elysia marginata]